MNADVDTEKLETAARLGHEASRGRLGLGPPPADWLEDLDALGRRALVRAAIAAALWALPLPLGEDLRAVEAAVEAAEAWTEDPSEANRVLARMANDELEALTKRLESEGTLDDDFRLELELASRAAQAASDLRPEAAIHHLREVLARLDGLDPEELGQVRDAMRASLLAWALGEPDPLRD